jgi:sugar lactone lactonase YvrE
MDMPRAELVVDARNAVGESPVWVPGEDALYWVDIPARRLHRWQARSGRVAQWTTAEMPACIAPHARGGWVCGMEGGVFHLELHDGGAVDARPLARVRHAQPGMRFNDGRCDRQGRLRAGTMVMDMGLASSAGRLYGLGADGLHALQDGLVTPNGLAFSPDGRTMYLSDSHPTVRTVWAYDYDTGDGTARNRRVFATFDAPLGRPDGAAVDADGCYWVCGNDAGLVHRFTPQGRLDRSLPVPVRKPAMCAFGGSGLDTLFVTSIRPTGIDLADQPLAGGLFALRPGVHGLPEPACSFSPPENHPQETP